MKVKDLLFEGSASETTEQLKQPAFFSSSDFKKAIWDAKADKEEVAALFKKIASMSEYENTAERATKANGYDVKHGSYLKALMDVVWSVGAGNADPKVKSRYLDFCLKFAKDFKRVFGFDIIKDAPKPKPAVKSKPVDPDDERYWTDEQRKYGKGGKYGDPANLRTTTTSGDRSLVD